MFYPVVARNVPHRSVFLSFGNYCKIFELLKDILYSYSWDVVERRAERSSRFRLQELLRANIVLAVERMRVYTAESDFFLALFVYPSDRQIPVTSTTPSCSNISAQQRVSFGIS